VIPLSNHNFRNRATQTGWLFYYEDNMNDKMNKEKILKTIRQSAKKLHRNPTLRRPGSGWNRQACAG